MADNHISSNSEHRPFWAAAPRPQWSPSWERVPFEWPSGVAGFAGESLDLRLGVTTYRLLTNVRRWVHRRVERIEIVGTSSARRRVSVDLNIPTNSWGVKGTVLVPVAILRKQAIIDFDMRDEQHRSVPVLTRYQTGYATLSMLEAVATALLPKSAGEKGLSPGLMMELARLAYDADAREPEDAIGDLRKCDEAAHLLENQVFEKLCRTMASRFLLIVELDPREGARRVVRFSYLQSLEGRLRFRQRIGWDPTDLAVHIPAVDEAGSYHLEIEIPPGLDIRPVQLEDNQTVGRVWGIASVEGAGHPEISSTDRLLPSHASERAGRVHFQQIGAPLGTDAVGEVWLGASLSGFLLSALAFALFVPVVLGAVLLGLGGNIETRATTTLLLTVAGIVSVFVARVGEHSLVSRILFYVRVVVWTLAILVFIAATLVALRVGGALLYGTWFGVLGLSVAITCLMIGVSVRRGPPKHGEHQPAIAIWSAEGNFLAGAAREDYGAIEDGLAAMHPEGESEPA